MKNMFKKLWNDEAGLVVSAELVFITTIAVIGMVVGLSTARDGVSGELADLNEAINELNQSYIINQVVGHSASVQGTQFTDGFDFCDITADDTGSASNACITYSAPGADETIAATAPTNL